MKETILSSIYSCFAAWSMDEQFCCEAGCSTCCTTDVTISALEGLRILNYCQREGLLEWLGRQLTQSSSGKAPELTTNEFVAALLNGQTVPTPDTRSEGKCLFLQNDRCIIYPIRPFSCRCFASTTPCSQSHSATVSDAYLDGSTTVMQIIEHLGQFDSWGYMDDILIQQAYLKSNLENIEVTTQLELFEQAQLRLRRARPISGFIISKDDNNSVTSLLQSIFSTKIDTRTIEQILNGEKIG